MSLTPQQLVDRLIAILPEFADEWNSPQNCFRDEDGSFTYCGAFSEYSHFVRDHYRQLKPAQLQALAEFVEQCMTPPGTDLATAAATCFLENLTGESCSADFESYLGPQALEFFRNFSVE